MTFGAAPTITGRPSRDTLATWSFGIRERLVQERPPEPEQWYALDSVFGYKINDPDAAQTLDPRQESETLRSQGAQTPTPSPAPPESPSNAITIPLGG